LKTLVLGAGPLGSLYAQLLFEAGNNVTILARGERYDWVKSNGLVTFDEFTGTKATSMVPVVDSVDAHKTYDLVIVLIRKNKHSPVFETLASNDNLKNILFMGNNALGFEEYTQHLPVEKLLFGFPGAGGGIRDQVVHYVDREKPGKKRRAVTIGEIDGNTTERTRSIKSLFESSGIPVHLTNDIDGWLKYHVALVAPLGNALYKHTCDTGALAKDKETLRTMVRAAKEGGRVLKALGYTKGQPIQFYLFNWLPESLNIKALRGLLKSKFAEVAFALHADAARDEFTELSAEFQSLIEMTSIETPNIDRLSSFNK
jgi:2-dehydropantoate 2-reductase